MQANAPEEWAIAQQAMSILDGKVPYCLCLGNHDMGYKKTDTNRFGFDIAVDRSTLFNKYLSHVRNSPSAPSLAIRFIPSAMTTLGITSTPLA